MVHETIENILDNGIFPLRIYQETIYIYYEGIWWAFDTAEQERLGLVKALVEKSIGRRAKAKEIDDVHKELKTIFKPLDGYIEWEEVFINLKDELLLVQKDGKIKTMAHSQELGFRWKMPYNYNEKAECPLFMKFLYQVIGEEDAIKVLQEYMGYVFLPHNHLNLEKALWLVGVGSNGKSVLTSLLKHLYGENNISYLNLTELNNDEKRAMLKGKIVNITQDASNRIDPSVYKMLISGENITFRELYKGPDVLRGVPKFIIGSNGLPWILFGIDAFVRRVILIPFNRVITEEERDVHLGEKLREEIEGIFNFALQGMQRLLQQKQFTRSTLIEKAILEYKGELDVLGDFLQDNPIESLHKKGSGHITQNELFKRLSSWCKDNNRKNSYQSPRKLRDKLVSDYGFNPYKNDTVYGIKGEWKNFPHIQMPVNNVKKVSPYD